MRGEGVGGAGTDGGPEAEADVDEVDEEEPPEGDGPVAPRSVVEAEVPQPESSGDGRDAVDDWTRRSSGGHQWDKTRGQHGAAVWAFPWALEGRGGCT